MKGLDEAPRLVAWETTGACNLSCTFCRAEAKTEPDPYELETQEVERLVDQIAEFSSPIFIITGGEPMMRDDVYEIADYASGRGLRPVMSPNGTLLDAESARRMLDSGIRRVSVSIDGPSARVHDSIRGTPGAFDDLVEGLRYAEEEGLEFQINTTVTRDNVDLLPDIHDTAVELGAAAWDVFMLVPTGRGTLEDEVGPARYEQVLNWIFEKSLESKVPVKVTCGPQYERIKRTRGGGPETSPGQPGVNHGRGDSGTPGCLGGKGFCFVSRRGEVYPCGYLPISAGNVRERHFMEIYRDSELFNELRDVDSLSGKCGDCGFREVCGGCRARAYGSSGDYMAEEPFCLYRPK